MSARPASPASRARRRPPWRRPQPRRRGRGAHGATRLRGRSPLALALRDPEERRESAEELALALGALSVELRCDELRIRRSISSGTGANRTCSAPRLEIAGRAASDEALLDELAPAVLAGEDSGDPEARRAYLAGLLGEIDETLAETLLAEAAP